jgi:hypothetical protein
MPVFAKNLKRIDRSFLIGSSNCFPEKNKESENDALKKIDVLNGLYAI